MQIKEIQTKELHIAEGVNNELHLTCEDDQNPMLVLHSKQLDDSASLTFEQATLAGSLFYYVAQHGGCVELSSRLMLSQDSSGAQARLFYAACKAVVYNGGEGSATVEHSQDFELETLDEVLVAASEWFRSELGDNREINS